MSTEARLSTMEQQIEMLSRQSNASTGSRHDNTTGEEVEELQRSLNAERARTSLLETQLEEAHRVAAIPDSQRTSATAPVSTGTWTPQRMGLKSNNSNRLEVIDETSSRRNTRASDAAPRHKSLLLPTRRPVESAKSNGASVQQLQHVQK